MPLDLVDQLEPRQGWGEESGKWCGRPDLNRHGLTPNGFFTRYGFRRPVWRVSAQNRFGVWTIPSPLPSGFRCCPSSLYNFPFPGLARDCHLTGSPEFGQFCIFSFPESTQVWLKSVASTNFATPAQGIAIALHPASQARGCSLVDLAPPGGFIGLQKPPLLSMCAADPSGHGKGTSAAFAKPTRTKRTRMP